MSKKSRLQRATERKPARLAGNTKTSNAGTNDLAAAQQRLNRAGDAFRDAQADRRRAVRAAWGRGVSAAVIGQRLGVSRQKVYDIIGHGHRAKTGQLL